MSMGGFYYLFSFLSLNCSCQPSYVLVLILSFILCSYTSNLITSTFRFSVFRLCYFAPPLMNLVALNDYHPLININCILIFYLFSLFKFNLFFLVKIETTAKLYKARFVINISELGKDDSLVQNVRP